MLRALRVIVPAVALVLLTANAASSTTVVRMTNQDLAEKADVVVHGKCVAKESRLSDDGSYVYTEYTIDVAEQLKGDDAAPRAFTFRSIGGVVNGRGTAIAGAAAYQQGEEVVTFLDKENAKTRCRFAVGMAQGKFSVVEDATRTRYVERDLKGLQVLDEKTGSAEEPGADPRQKFEPFMSEIRGYCKNKKSGR
jgi:hypothetical protein